METKAVFEKRIEDIQAIIDTPNTIRGIALNALRSANNGAEMNNPIRNAIKTLENIKDKSIADSYKAIYNTACVLSVSALSDAFRSLFIEYGLANGFKLQEDYKRKLSIDINKLVQINKYSDTLSKIIIEHDESISFEDLGSVVRTFENHYQYKLNLSDKEEEAIIFYGQCRHVLAHAGGTVNEVFMNRVTQRSVNIKDYQAGDEVNLDSQDWNSIKRYFSDVVSRIAEASIIF